MQAKTSILTSIDKNHKDTGWHFYLPHGVLSSQLACDAVPSRVALSSELRATAITMHHGKPFQL